MLGSLISAGTSLLGGLFSSSSARRQASEANAAQERIAQRNIDLQKEFAQSGIQWKVADAKAAGLHPLAALGAQTTSFSPVSVGTAMYEDPMGSAIASAGQDFGRAVDATRSQGDRVNAYVKTAQELSLQRMGLENTLLASQIARVRQPASGPPMPTAQNRWMLDGQGETSLPAVPTIPVSRSPLVSDIPLERVNADPAQPFAEPGSITDLGYSRTSTGYHPVPSQDVKSRIEDDWVSQTLWNIRNRLAPSFHINRNPPFKAPAGERWIYDQFAQEYRLVPEGRWSYGVKVK